MIYAFLAVIDNTNIEFVKPPLSSSLIVKQREQTIITIYGERQKINI